MASLSYKSGRAVIQWLDARDKRHTIGIAGIDRTFADDARRHVGALAAARIAKELPPDATRAWVDGLWDRLYRRLVSKDLVPPRRIPTAPVPEDWRYWFKRPAPGQRVYVTYFVQGDPGTPIKIGISFDLCRRMIDLQCGSPSRLQCLGILGGGQEKKMHRRFKALRISGEWFRAAPELLDFIAKECRR